MIKEMDLYFEQGRYQLTANIKCANTTLPSFKAINEKSVADIFCVSPSGGGGRNFALNRSPPLWNSIITELRPPVTDVSISLKAQSDL